MILLLIATVDSAVLSRRPGGDWRAGGGGVAGGGGSGARACAGLVPGGTGRQ